MRTLVSPDARRIAWFLHLRRILQFQKSHLAPRALRAAHPGPAEDELTSARLVGLNFPAQRIRTSQQRPSQVPGFHLPGLPGAYVPGADGRGAILPGVATAMDALEARKGVYKSTASKFSRGDFRRYGGDSISVGRQKPDGFDPQPKWSVGRRLANAHLRYRGNSAIRAIHAAHQTERSTVLGEFVAGTADTLAAHEEKLGLPTPPSPPRPFGKTNAVRQIVDKGRQSEKSKPHPMMQMQDSEGLSGTRDEKASASATVYLDGSVLGRWAIEHLERTLGKAPTGMTGVDPRTSLPRGRVSPF